MKTERTYEKGRSTAGWTATEKILSLEDIRAGDVLIMISHAHKAENLVRVKEIHEWGFLWNYVKEDGVTSHPVIGVDVMNFMPRATIEGSRHTDLYYASRELSAIPENLPL